MADTRGIFSLRELKEEKDLGLGVDINSVFIAPESGTSTNCGYYGGGHPGSRSTMDKLTYADDTTVAVPGGALSAGRYGLAATGSQTAGYFSGGFANSVTPHSTTDRITYSTDTTARVPGADLSIGIRYYLGATGNITAGYYGGGQPASKSTMEKLTYSSETFAEIPSGALSSGRGKPGAVSNSTHGYFGGGMDYPSYFSTMDKFAFSNDTTARVPTADLSIERGGFGGVTGNSTHGYFGGGLNPTYRSTMDKLEYSGDTVSEIPGAALSSARAYGAATGNSTTSGYFGGGATAPFETMDKTNFTDDTTAHVPGADLSIGRHYIAAAGPRSNVLPSAITFPTKQFATGQNIVPGYAVGGQQNPASPWVQVSTIEKMNYVTETVSGSTDLTYETSGASPVTNGSTAGYVGAGFGSGSNISNIGKLVYASDTTSRIPSNTTGDRRWGGGFTAPSAGYFSHGSPLTSTDKITFSDETVAVAPGLTLPVPGTSKYNAANFGMPDRGYIMWGGGASTSSYVITYSTDTLSTSPALDGPPAPVRAALTGWQNSNYGFIFGGRRSSYMSTVDKVELSTDTVQNANPLAVAASGYCGASAGGSQFEAYLFGGINNLDGGSTDTTSNIQRYTMSTDTASASVGSLGASRYATAATGNGLGYGYSAPPLPTPTTQTAFVPSGVPTPGFGYVMGGNSGPPNRSTVSKMTYSSETMSTLPSSLSGARYGGMAVSTASNAYQKGGFGFSSTDRLNYSTSTTTVLPACTEGAPYNERRFPKTTMDKSRGYAIGGSVPGINGTSACFLTFATETCETKTDAAIFDNADGYGIGDLTRGYYAGHQGPGNNPSTNLMKLVYSTDLFSAVPGGITHARSWTTAVGDDTNGYFYGYIVPTGFSFIDKLVFSTETNSVITASTVAPDQWHAAGYSSTTVGYISQGFNPSTAPDYYYTNTSKLTFSDETTAAVPGGDALYTAYGSMGTSAQGYGVGASSGGDAPVIC